MLVLLRHGKTEWSRQNRFAGWADAPLSPAGVKEARDCGRMIAATGLDFDLCCTSYLSRTAQTLEIVLETVGLTAVPIERTWRLNERHYG